MADTEQALPRAGLRVDEICQGLARLNCHEKSLVYGITDSGKVLTFPRRRDLDLSSSTQGRKNLE